MKKFSKPAMIIALCALSITQTGCFGEFALTRKAYDWHASIGNKFVRSLLLWIPMGFVYGITAMVDTVVLNLIEFWSGSNPLSMNEGDHEMQLLTIKGIDYRIDATKDTFTTTQLSGEMTGEVRIMKFDRADLTWKYTDSRVCEQPVMTFLDDQAEHVLVYTDNGTMEITAADMQDRDVLMAKLGSPCTLVTACAN
ncbi:MAG: DUF3332 family protein [Flavobacteriales bacterium]|nr:DUF3332 family protein [Flavobacteriales bacterium]MCC6938434.1 DUF3332 family protein [Flavobacteriales bacterium]